MKMVIIDDKLLNSCMSNQGGYTRNMVSALGASWPLKKGWKRKLLGKVIDKDTLPFNHDPQISISIAEEFGL